MNKIVDEILNNNNAGIEQKNHFDLVGNMFDSGIDADALETQNAAQQKQATEEFITINRNGEQIKVSANDVLALLDKKNEPVIDNMLSAKQMELDRLIAEAKNTLANVSNKQEPVTNYTPLSDEYEDAIIEMHKILHTEVLPTVQKLKTMEPQISNMANSQQQERVMQVYNKMQDKHKSIFNRPMTIDEETKLAQNIVSAGIAPTNEQMIDLIYDNVFKNQIELARGAKERPNVTVMNRGQFTNNEQIENVSRVGSLPDLSKATSARDAQYIVKDHLRRKYNI